MKYHKIYFYDITENVHHILTRSLLQAVQVFQNARASLKITTLIFDIKLYFNTLSTQLLGLMFNGAVVLRLSRTRLIF
ncbi:MAG: hypothetical protein ACI83B_001857 [Sediminicola sp.]|jgi:hypothetical protein